MTNTDFRSEVAALNRRLDELTERFDWGDVEHRIIVSGDNIDEAKAECRCGWTRNYSYAPGPKYRQFPAIADKARLDHKAEHDAAKAPKIHEYTRTVIHNESPCGAMTGTFSTSCSCGTSIMRTTFGHRMDPRKPVTTLYDAEKMIQSFEESHKSFRGAVDSLLGS